MTDINDLAEDLYANARNKGFYDHEDRLRYQVETAGETAHRLSIAPSRHATFVKTQLAEHFGNRLMLIAGEAIEAHEELRSGRGVAELYFSGDLGEGESGITHIAEANGVLLKPEGVLAELADIAIRTLETMASILDQASDEEKAKLRAQVPQNEATCFKSLPAGIEMEQVNVGEVIILKHDFNQSRSKFHGGRKF